MQCCFHGNNGYANAPQCYVINTLPVSLHLQFMPMQNKNCPELCFSDYKKKFNVFFLVLKLAQPQLLPKTSMQRQIILPKDLTDTRCFFALYCQTHLPYKLSRISQHILQLHYLSILVKGHKAKQIVFLFWGNSWLTVMSQHGPPAVFHIFHSTNRSKHSL